MKRKIGKIITIISLVSCLCATSVYAQIPKAGANSRSILLQEDKNYAKDVKYSKVRGSIMSTALAEISNEGKGTIYVSLETLAHYSCDKIRHKGYLDRWNEAEQSWAFVKSYDYSETIEDTPDGDLSMLLSEIFIKDQPAGFYYRVRGVHTVWLDGRQETLETQTDSILLTSQ